MANETEEGTAAHFMSYMAKGQREKEAPEIQPQVHTLRDSSSTRS